MVTAGTMRVSTRFNSAAAAVPMMMLTVTTTSMATLLKMTSMPKMVSRAALLRLIGIRRRRTRL